MENEPVFSVVLKVPAELYTKLRDMRLRFQSTLSIEAYTLDLLSTGRQLLESWKMNGVKNNSLSAYQSYIEEFNNGHHLCEQGRPFLVTYKTNQTWVLGLDQDAITRYLFIALHKLEGGTEYGSQIS
ncbi:hypothetical protein [Leuconostoc citreum]|uniref:hypothetical protein n=1 Tax=Leuconostoc citreum TaxID=33964 RepID=UPI0032DF9CBD